MFGRFKKFFVEKTILGLEEFIEIDGIGKLRAKLDTGNGGYCVLHGENLQVKNNRVKFVTDVNGKPVTVMKPIVDTITVNVGAGNTEERPVVEFNIMIGGRAFSNVPFSIGNRKDNEHKILVGKGFIENELDALIDVGLTYAAEDGIEVNY